MQKCTGSADMSGLGGHLDVEAFVQDVLHGSKPAIALQRAAARSVDALLGIRLGQSDECLGLAQPAERIRVGEHLAGQCGHRRTELTGAVSTPRWRPLQKGNLVVWEVCWIGVSPLSTAVTTRSPTRTSNCLPISFQGTE